MILQKNLNLGMDYKMFIETVPGKRFARHCVKGTRIAVSDVLNWLSNGMTKKEILRDYPELTADQINACIAFDADNKNRA